MKFLDDFSKVNVLIVGDIMLDRYWWGSVNRISPEAPVPVVDLKSVTLAAGGAANVAANVAGLGARSFLVGVMGDDADGFLFAKVLADQKISADFLFKLSSRPTTVKTRVVGHNQQIVRIDQETKDKLSEEDEAEVLKIIKSVAGQIQILIISDYGKGFLTEKLLSSLITSFSNKGILILVDPKGKNFQKYKGANLITPNKHEISEAFSLENEERATIEKFGTRIIEKLSLDALLVTQGEEGMTLFQKNDAPVHLPATAREVYDVTGAGDTVIACLAVALASGMSFLESARVANTAAGLIVEQLGTAAITLEMLRAALEKK